MSLYARASFGKGRATVEWRGTSTKDREKWEESHLRMGCRLFERGDLTEAGEHKPQIRLELSEERAQKIIAALAAKV